MTRVQMKQTTTGAVLIALGVILLANALEVGQIGRAWPVVLLIAGLPRLFAPDSADERWGGVWLTGLGVLFLLHTSGLFRLRESWPLGLILFGLSLIIRRQPSPAATKEG